MRAAKLDARVKAFQNKCNRYLPYLTAWQRIA